RKDWPQASVQQLVGDYYGACMDEARINQQGYTPIKPMLAEIDQIKDTNGVLLMVRRFQDLGISVPFGLTSTPDQHNPGQTIAYSDADAKAAATSVFNMETKLAEASLDNIALREPENTDHVVAFSALEKMAPKFDWAGYFQGAKIGPGDLNVQEPKFLAEVNR